MEWYQIRIEGLLAPIRRWTCQRGGGVYWHSVSQDNILTIYGKDENSRIFDPADRSRIFTWMICEIRDDRGNAVQYQYNPEHGTGVDLTKAHRRNRGDRYNPRRTD